MAYAALLKFPDCCGNWPRRLACAMRAFCTIATPNSTTKLVRPYFPKKPQQQTTPQNCPSLFLSFYTTKFSIQPNYNPTRWNMTKKNPNGRRQKKSKWKTTKTISKYSKLLRSLACAIWCKFHILFLYTLDDDLNGKRPWRRTTALKVRFCIFASEIFFCNSYFLLFLSFFFSPSFAFDPLRGNSRCENLCHPIFWHNWKIYAKKNIFWG